MNNLEKESTSFFSTRSVCASIFLTVVCLATYGIKTHHSEFVVRIVEITPPGTGELTGLRNPYGLPLLYRGFGSELVGARVGSLSKEFLEYICECFISDREYAQSQD